MIFPLIETESIVQVNDKTRLSGVKCFVSKDEVALTAVSIEPEAGAGFISVYGVAPINSKNWFLDWSYATDGAKTVTIKVNNGGADVTLSKTINIISAVDDKLWSSDDDLMQYEPDIMQWVRIGRSSFLDYHRLSQKRILEWFDNIKVWDKDGKPFTKDDVDQVMAVEDLKRISVYWVLEMIFGGLSNKPDDTFAQKEKNYRASRKEVQADRSRIRIDFDKDGTVEDGEKYQMRSIRLTR